MLRSLRMWSSKNVIYVQKLFLVCRDRDLNEMKFFGNRNSSNIIYEFSNLSKMLHPPMIRIRISLHKIEKIFHPILRLLARLGFAWRSRMRTRDSVLVCSALVSTLLVRNHKWTAASYSHHYRCMATISFLYEESVSRFVFVVHKLKNPQNTNAVSSGGGAGGSAMVTAALSFNAYFPSTLSRLSKWKSFAQFPFEFVCDALSLPFIFGEVVVLFSGKLKIIHASILIEIRFVPCLTANSWLLLMYLKARFLGLYFLIYINDIDYIFAIINDASDYIFTNILFFGRKVWPLAFPCLKGFPLFLLIQVFVVCKFSCCTTEHLFWINRGHYADLSKAFHWLDHSIFQQLSNFRITCTFTSFGHPHIVDRLSNQQLVYRKVSFWSDSYL